VTFIICPNLSIDRVLTVEVLRPGEMMRCRALHQQAGSKGANVLRALSILESDPPADAGGEHLLAGFAAGHGGRLIAELASEEGLNVELVVCDGEARASTVLLGTDGAVTRLYEYGPEIGPSEASALLAIAAERPATLDEWAIIDGAAPPGASDDLYAALSHVLRTAGYRIMVDAVGAQLAGALDARPDFVKVNLSEACSAVGEPESHCPDEKPAPHGDLLAEGLELSHRLVGAGAGGAVVTLGAAGAAGYAEDREWQVQTPPVKSVNPVGSGDCFAAGLLLGLERGWPLDAALRSAAGAAAANAASPLTGHFALELACELAGQAYAGPPGH
jgi:1-phosphofructokinase family hexose kinase